jgi:hypothetical protein
MAGETNSDRINRLDRSTATLITQMDNLRDSVERVNTTATDLDRRLRDVDRHLTRLAEKVDRLETQSNKFDSRRWNVWLLIVSVIASGLIGGLLTKSLDRLFIAPSNQTGSAPPAFQGNKGT